MTADLILRALLTLMNAVLAGTGLFAVIYLALNDPTFENQALLALVSMVVGALVREFGASNQWWFGSSKGSSDKTSLLRKP
jgi:ABC-type branched-subunit amino acid transport system permease subunit